MVVYIDGVVGKIEANILERKEKQNSCYAVVCHPNPLEQGTMSNKVVTTTAKALGAVCDEVIRFNYRGVGNSDGSYGNVLGEIEDCLSVISWLKDNFGDKDLILAGFSFGAFISLNAASSVDNLKALISIGPSVNMHDYNAVNYPSCPWLIIHGDDDEIVPAEQVHQWYEQTNLSNMQLIRYADTTHFFHGKLIDLRNSLKVFLDNI